MVYSSFETNRSLRSTSAQKTRRSTLRDAHLPVHDDATSDQEPAGREHRAQIRFGDPVEHEMNSNPIARDIAGVDVTLVLAVDPEEIHCWPRPADLRRPPDGYLRLLPRSPRRGGGARLGSLGANEGGRHPAPELGGLGDTRRISLRPPLDYVRFEAKATGLGLNPGLRAILAESFSDRSSAPHDLEGSSGSTRHDPRHRREQLPAWRGGPGWCRRAPPRSALDQRSGGRLR